MTTTYEEVSEPAAVVRAKACKTCGEEKPLGEFAACGITADRLHPNCRACQSAKMRLAGGRPGPLPPAERARHDLFHRIAADVEGLWDDSYRQGWADAIAWVIGNAKAANPPAVRDAANGGSDDASPQRAETAVVDGGGSHDE